MLIPLRTDREAARRPVITEILIAINVLVFVASHAGPHFGWFEEGALWQWGWYMASQPEGMPGLPHWARLFSYQFLHDSQPWHIGFNMLFLWVFGSAVEDRFKRIGFLSFYLMGGAVAAILHGQSTAAPVIGASGSVAAVTGAFLALFPRSTIATLIFFYIRHVPAVWLIGLYFVIDFLRWTTGMFTAATMSVAHLAHIAGYVYGFGLAFTLLGLRIIPRKEMDVFFMFSQWRRRRAFRAVSQQSRGASWDAPIRTGHEQLAQHTPKPRAMTEREQAEAAERAAIAKLMADHDLAGAAQRYRQLLSRNVEAVLPEDRQLDIANQLAAEKHDRHAAIAYELLLKSYPKSPKADEVRLMLGMIYLRRLGNRERAKELLEAARPGLRDPKQTQFADLLLAEV